MDYNIGFGFARRSVLVYVLKGDSPRRFYTEVLQFFMIVLGFAPVVYSA